jgi:hypothetical protein
MLFKINLSTESPQRAGNSVPRAPVTGTRKIPPWYDLTFFIISWPLICVLVYTEQ